MGKASKNSKKSRGRSIGEARKLEHHYPHTHRVNLVAEWIHSTLLGIILPTIKLKVYTFLGGL